LFSFTAGCRGPLSFLLKAAFTYALLKEPGTPVAHTSSEVKMTTGKFIAEALGFGFGYSKGGAEQYIKFEGEVHGGWAQVSKIYGTLPAE
jgi:hypothetical protein